MNVGSAVLRRFAVGAMVAGIAVTGAISPAQAAAPSDSTNGCSSFKRVEVKNKWEVLDHLVQGDLYNHSDTTQTLVLERRVEDTNTTDWTYRADWTLFKDAFATSVSYSVTDSHTISTTAQIRVEVAPRRKYTARGSARQWYVESEVVERNSNCNYKTERKSGLVATKDDIVWHVWDAGPA